MSNGETSQLLVPKEVARRLRCQPVSVYRAIARGELEAVRLGEHGSLRVSDAALERFLRPAHVEREASA